MPTVSQPSAKHIERRKQQSFERRKGGDKGGVRQPCTLSIQDSEESSIFAGSDQPPKRSMLAACTSTVKKGVIGTAAEISDAMTFGVSKVGGAGKGLVGGSLAGAGDCPRHPRSTPPTNALATPLALRGCPRTLRLQAAHPHASDVQPAWVIRRRQR